MLHSGSGTSSPQGTSHPEMSTPDPLRTSDPMTCAATDSATSLLALGFGLTPSVARACRMTLMYGPAVAPVNLSARQAKEMGWMTSGICGPTSNGSSRSADLQSFLESRLRAATQNRGSTLYTLTWKPWVTPSGRSRFRLRASVRRTSETGFIGWPTPTATLAEKGVRTFEGGLIEAMRNHGPDLAAVACLTGWPTTTSTDALRFPSLNATTPNITLNHAANLAGWPTPMAGTPAQNGNNAAGNNDSSRKTVWLCSESPASSAAIPTRRASECTAIARNVPAAGPAHPSMGSSAGAMSNLWVAYQRPGPTNGLWAAADWLLCRDGRWRPVEPGPQQMVDGFAESLGRLRPNQCREVAEEMNAYAYTAKADLREALLDVWMSLAAQTLQRTSRRLADVREAPVLLAYLRQLADEGWEIAQSLPRPSSKATERNLRMLWEQASASRAPCQRGLDRQPAGECADIVRVLSSVLARHAQTCWGEAFARYVSDAFPLAIGARSRVGRLRAYGNAINAEQATLWCELTAAAILNYDADHEKTPPI